MQPFIHRIAKIINGWDQATNKVLELEPISQKEMQELIKDTRRIVQDHCKHSFVPKQFVELFIEMEEFLFFASMIEEKEKGIDFYDFQDIFNAVHNIVFEFLDEDINE